MAARAEAGKLLRRVSHATSRSTVYDITSAHVLSSVPDQM